MRIVVCGAGALGSTAVWFCRNLDAELAVIDFDRVESKNLLAQAFTRQAVGKNKAEALKLQLWSFFGKRIEAYGVRLADANVNELCGSADLLVDAFDNASSRCLLSAYAKTAGKPLVHVAMTADGTFGLVRWEERFRADEEGVQGEATCEGGNHLPFIGVLGATLARVIQDYVTSGVRRDVMVNLHTVRAH